MSKKVLDELFEPVTKRTNPEAWRRYEKEQLEERKVYALKMLELQEKVGLTYKEARVFLLSRSSKMLYDLSMEWGITMEAVYNLSRRALRKLEAAGLDKQDYLGPEQGFID